MSTGGEPGHLHRTEDGTPVGTRVHGYFYLFYDKHHGQRGDEISHWAKDVSEPEEFGIFDRADELDLSDEKGNLYGLRIGPDGKLRELGTLEQQLAKFPYARPGQPWHGFPLWPTAETRGPHPPARRPPREILDKMEASGLLNAVQKRRLRRGR